VNAEENQLAICQTSIVSQLKNSTLIMV